MLSINMNDVISVLQSCAPYLIALGIVIVLGVISMIACIKLSKSKKYLIRTQAGIAMVLTLVIVVNLIAFGPMNTLISLATGNGSISAESAAEAEALGSDISAEGMVLLKNDNNALPLSSGVKLNVFGWSSTNPVYGGTGSGGLSDAYETVTLLDSLKAAGFEVNQDLVDFYNGYRATRPTVGMWGQDWTVPEPTIAEYESADIFNSAKNYSDTAVVFIARSGGEGADLPTSLSSDDTFVDGGTFGSSGVRYSSNTDDLDASKHYLELSNREQAMLDRVTSDYDKVIVIVNAANAMELGFLDEYDSIKAAIWFAGPGQTGFTALGQILNGTVNPSGKTVDTFVKDLTKTPNYNNFGSTLYDNMDDLAYVASDWRSGATTTTIPSFVNYVEGIYLGYKYYETAYAEGQAGFDYDATVQYPFGYGLSYTTFTQKMGPVSDNGGVLSFDVTVTNTGNAAGKDVVQVYYNPPYSNGGIEKATANLVAFDKTDLLEPGASQTITITFNAEDMASYDAYGAGSYVLERGNYVISVNGDSHTVLDEKTYTVNGTVTYGEGNARSTDAVAAVNHFDSDEGNATYLSRADGFANYAQATAAPTDLSMPEEYKSTFYNNMNYVPEDHNNPSDVMPTTGAKNGLTLSDLRGKSYDDAQWDALLDQLTIADMNSLISLGGYQTAPAASVGKVQTVDCDGPASINNNFTGTSSIGFPAATMIAATWNTDLALAFGESIGKMADEMEVSGWYAPAMNTHRSAFSGRNFEYYSEDGLLAGKMAASAVIGAEKHGVYAYLKHFALNDQETSRGDMLCTWSTEQAIREIYLKPFEISVKEGGAKAIMSAFNYIGNQWAGACSDLLNTVLRDEWGFRGFVLTDYFGGGAYMDAEIAIRNGNDACLAPMDVVTNNVHDTTSATSVLAMRQASKNILYTTANSRAYAPENLKTGPQGWQIAAIAVDVLVLAALIAIEVLVVRKGYAKRKSSSVNISASKEKK